MCVCVCADVVDFFCDVMVRECEWIPCTCGYLRARLYFFLTFPPFIYVKYLMFT